ncbi:MAG TPA: PEGA domain-containing protein [Myxococcota bacterium]|nr:PEGA domain-containing protein [Myxococcota bacterium]HRY95702.1 PEGA domain-containing protein [Myxococcota bacterium]
MPGAWTRLGLWCVAALAPAGALAAPPAPDARARVALVDLSPGAEPGYRSRDQALRDALAADLAGRPGVEVLPAEALAEFFRAPRDPQAEPLAARARAQIAKGQELFVRLKAELAIVEFQGALRLLEAAFADLERLDDLAEAHLGLGVTYQAQGQDAQAEREFQRVLLLQPERQLDEAVYSPLVLERFERARQQLATSLKGSVSLLSQPPGADVRMDGRPVGATPITIPDVRPGAHYFSLRLDGHRTWSGVLEVRPGGVERQEVFLVEGERIERVRLRQRLEAGPRAADAEALAQGLGVGWLVLVSFEHPAGQSMLRVSAFRAGEREVLAAGVFSGEAEALAALGERLGRWLAGDRTALAAPGPTGFLPGGEPLPPPPEETAWYEQWWVWTLVGVAVVGAATATTVVLLQGDSGIDLSVYR